MTDIILYTYRNDVLAMISDSLKMSGRLSQTRVRSLGGWGWLGMICLVPLK